MWSRTWGSLTWLVLHILILSWIVPNQGQNTSPWVCLEQSFFIFLGQRAIREQSEHSEKSESPQRTIREQSEHSESDQRAKRKRAIRVILSEPKILRLVFKVCYTDKCPDCGRLPPGSTKMRLHQEYQDPETIKIRTKGTLRSLAEIKPLRTATSREEKENAQSYQTNYFVVWNFH